MKLSIDHYPYLDSAALFACVAEQPWAVMLDSGVIWGAKNPSNNNNCDVLAIKPETTLVSVGSKIIINTENEALEHSDDPLSLLKSHIPTIEYDELASAYLPGAIGYFSYDLVREYEDLPSVACNEEQLPEMAMGIYSVVVVIDHQKKQTSLISIDDYQHNHSTVTEWRDLIENAIDGVNNTFVVASLVSQKISENIDYAQYQKLFDRVRDYTIEGDCYQVNLAKQFTAIVEGNPWQSYLELRNSSPAPYGAYCNYPFATILSNSPESFIQCRDSNVTTSPIKGTKARDHESVENDKLIAKSLLNSAKDRAENLMIVDLMRNDLSRCCELNSVKVPKLFELHSFANVHHLISTIVGKLKNDLHPLDLLKSCFPGGSITGAPKIRAMQIIEELEPNRRGLYCGSIGYVGVDGSLETNIAIRTIVIKDGVARYSAGGGLVIDSDVKEEYQEIIDKASMMKQVFASNTG